MTQLLLAGYQKLIAVAALVLLAIRARLLNEYSPILTCAALVACLASCLTTRRWIASLTWISASYPILATLAIVTTWLAAALELGHIPRTGLDDPARVGKLTPALHQYTWFILYLAPEMLILCLTSAVFRISLLARKTTHDHSPNKRFYGMLLFHIMTTFAPWLATAGFAEWDPGECTSLFFD